MRIEIKHNYGRVEITVEDKDYLMQIREFMDKYSLEGPVWEITPGSKKIKIPWTDIYEGGMK